MIALDQKRGEPGRTKNSRLSDEPRRAPVRTRGDRSARARDWSESVEDRRPRADTTPSPIVRRAAGPHGDAGPGSHCRRRRAVADQRNDTGRPTSFGPIVRGAWRRRLAGRGPGSVPNPARPPGRYDLSARGCSGQDRRRADGADESSQPDAPGAGRAAGSSRSRRAGPDDCPPAGLAGGYWRLSSPNGIKRGGRRATNTRAVELSVLCRRTEQIEAALRLGISTIYADYQDIKHYAEAVAAVRRGSQTAAIYLATPRIEKPGEVNLFSFLARQGADGILVRNAGGMRYCAEHDIPSLADFSLNAANPLTVELLKSRGAARVTASYDLNIDQLLQLIDTTPPSWLEVVIHQQIPMFHMEHCVFCAFLSPGTDATNCGRPCDDHDVKLRDRVGKEHPLKADVGCRNTLYNAVPQTAAEYLARLQ